MKNIILIFALLSCAISLNAQSTADRHSPEFKNNTVNFNKDFRLTDVYADKFLGRWVWQNNNDRFEMILNPITYNTTDLVSGVIKYEKGGTLVENTIQNMTVRTDRVNVTPPHGDLEYMKINSVSACTSSEYVLDVLMYDKGNDREYEGTMTMSAGDPARAVLKLADKSNKGWRFYNVADGPPPPPDTTVYFPREMLMIKVQ